MPRQARQYRCWDIGGVYGAGFGDDVGIGEPDGETGRNDGDGCMGRVICIYVPLIKGTSD